jgi:hypothetical protein
MSFLQKNKALGLIALVLVAGLAYYVYTSATGSPPVADLTSVDVSGGQSGELLSTLNDLNNITLSTAVFSDPVYISLTDFGVVIPPEPSGRGDPFLPFSAPPAKGGTTLPTSGR